LSHTAGDEKKKERLEDYVKIIKNLNLPKQGNMGSPSSSSSGKHFNTTTFKLYLFYKDYETYVEHTTCMNHTW